MSARMFVGIVAGLMLVGGAVFGFLPVKASTDLQVSSSISCGSAFAQDIGGIRRADLSAIYADGGRHSYADLPSSQAACDDARAPRQYIAWGLVIVGGIALAGSLLVNRERVVS